MLDVLCIGTAVIDICAYPIPNQEEWKEKQRIDSITLGLGGDAANTSVRLADFGWNCALSGSVGRDANGEILKGILKSRNVKTRYLSWKEKEKTGTAVVMVDPNGRRNVFSIHGAHSMLERYDLPELSECYPQLIGIGSLLSLPVLEGDGLLEYLQLARDMGILIAADLANDKRKKGMAGIRRFLPYLDYFWPSDYDARRMTGKETVEEAAEIFLKLGCKNVVIKCGEKGCFYLNRTQSGWISAPDIRPVDTTGAGDCMAALMIDQILQGKDLPTACRYACAGASVSTLSQGASETPITRKQIEDVLENQKNNE